MLKTCVYVAWIQGDNTAYLVTIHQDYLPKSPGLQLAEVIINLIRCILHLHLQSNYHNDVLFSDKGDKAKITSTSTRLAKRKSAKC